MRTGKQVRFLIHKSQSLVQNIYPRLKPSAICIGAQKAGTTALYHYLSCHPNVEMPIIKEIDFFNCNSRYSRGNKFYHSHFPIRKSVNLKKYTLDITPGYLGSSELAVERIYNYNSDIRLIILLRNPITRAYSAWQMYREKFIHNPDWFFEWMLRCESSASKNDFIKRPLNFGQDFESDIIDEITANQSGQKIEMPILMLGMYHHLLKHYFARFPKKQILIISSEAMKNDTNNQLRRIETFIGLRPHRWSQEEIQPHFEGSYKEKMSAGEYKLLKSFYHKPNVALFDLLQRDFDWR